MSRLTKKQYNPKTGRFEDVAISRTEMKRTIMQANNWNETQYRKQYDIFKNKLRFFEAVQESRGIDVNKQSPQELLYKAAKAKMRYGSDYQPSEEMQMIQSVAAHSISKGKRISQNRQSVSYKRTVGRVLSIKMGAFIEYGYKVVDYIINGKPLTKESEEFALRTDGVEYSVESDGQIIIDGELQWETLNGKEMKPITDPVEQEKAIAAFADWLHAKYPRSGKDKNGSKKGVGGFVQGETFGSDAGIDDESFDFSEWLD